MARPWPKGIVRCIAVNISNTSFFDIRLTKGFRFCFRKGMSAGNIPGWLPVLYYSSTDRFIFTLKSMRKVQLYIAASIDGYIARPDGGVDWLSKVEKEGEDYGYGSFIASIDTTLMGRKTYDEVLGFGVPFPYMNTANYVFTRQERQPDNNPVQFIREDPADFVGKLREQPGGNIWLIGGGGLNTVLLNAGLIDEMILSVIPIVLGEGIPLFGGQPKETHWKVAEHQVFDTGLVQLRYLKG